MYYSPNPIRNSYSHNETTQYHGSSAKNSSRDRVDSQEERYGSASERRRNYDAEQYGSFNYAGMHSDNSENDGRHNNMMQRLTGGGKDKSSDKHPNLKPLAKYQSIVLKVQIHCHECIRKVKKTLVKMDGVDSVRVDVRQQSVTVTGYIDPLKVLKKARKTGKCVELLPSRSDPVTKSMSNENRARGFPSGAGYSSAAGSFDVHADKNSPTLTYPASSAAGSYDVYADKSRPALTDPASRDDETYALSEENDNSCCIL